MTENEILTLIKINTEILNGMKCKVLGCSRGGCPGASGGCIHAAEHFNTTIKGISGINENGIALKLTKNRSRWLKDVEIPTLGWYPSNPDPNSVPQAP